MLPAPRRVSGQQGGRLRRDSGVRVAPKKMVFRVECGLPQYLRVTAWFWRVPSFPSPPVGEGQDGGTCGRPSLTPTPALPRRGGGGRSERCRTWLWRSLRHSLTLQSVLTAPPHLISERHAEIRRGRPRWQEHQVRVAPAIRRPEALQWGGGVWQEGDRGARPAFTPGSPGPDPDLLQAGHGPERVNVPVEFLFSPEVACQPSQEIPLGRAGIHVPSRTDAAGSETR